MANRGKRQTGFAGHGMRISVVMVSMACHHPDGAEQGPDKQTYTRNANMYPTALRPAGLQ